MKVCNVVGFNFILLRDIFKIMRLTVIRDGSKQTIFANDRLETS